MPEPFDLRGPLPSGTTTLLEASAGTGKTFTVGALVTRYVAEGVAELDEMLVITFGRAASQELRARVRAQLVAAERAVADPAGVDPTDELLTSLVDVGPEELTRRRQRLRSALAAFDAATIATTHQFCQQVLRSLGVAGDTDSGATLVESLDELVVEVVDDVYLARFGQEAESPPFNRAQALALARTVVGDPQARLSETEADPATQAGARVWFGQAVRDELDRRKRRLGILSYDDLLSRLATALEDEDAPARERMRRRWRIVLVDEFQDTDPVQWQVLDRAFSGHATMVLIGDPKQAIYAFRGGDVVTYLTAAETASVRATLGTNWRSDSDLVDRLQVVLRGAALGDPRIMVRDVESAHRGSRLEGAPQSSPFRIRQVLRPGFRLSRSGDIPVGDARDHIARDCAGDIAALLASGATWDGARLRAGQVAVIVGARDHGLLVQRYLAERGVPAVVAGGGHVFGTPAADDWLGLLEGLEQPHRSGRVRAAALTSFFGYTTADLADDGERLTDRVADSLRGWALLLRARGVAALFEAAEERELSARVLGFADGERTLTDLRHLAQTMHETSVRDRLGLTALLQWFREERRRTAGTERPRRLDSDAAAVQIVTVHGSKGLQYPVTYLPFAFQRYLFKTDWALFHDHGVRTLDVSGAGRAWPAHERSHLAEEAGEELRDLYVALTRAQSQVVTWWAPTANTPDGGLHRLLFGRQPGVAEVPDRQAVRDDDYATNVLGLLEQLGGPTLEQATVAIMGAPTDPVPSERLEVRAFDRDVDAAWRRTSYSGLVHAAEATAPGELAVDGVSSEPEVPGLSDEDPPAADLGVEPTLRPGAQLGERSGTGTGTATGTAATPTLVSPMAELPAGATLGSLVHAVLEHADPLAADFEAELRTRAAEQLPWWPVDVTAETLARALLPLHQTSLGSLAAGLTLGEIPLTDRLRELDFEFPLVGGDVRRGPDGVSPPEVRLRGLAPLLRTHLPPGDPLYSYADRLEEPALGDQPLRGYLVGSIDVVLRVPDPLGGHRFLVVDYKTNLLGEQGRPVTSADYGTTELAEAMLHSHYPLQALLYSVVVHRYLRWRISGYRIEKHLGGVLYLFLRGMCGVDTPAVDGQVAGVFAWQPPGPLVEDLSRLLDGEGVTA